jgi:hypothetical protein
LWTSQKLGEPNGVVLSQRAGDVQYHHSQLTSAATIRSHLAYGDFRALPLQFANRLHFRAHEVRCTHLGGLGS